MKPIKTALQVVLALLAGCSGFALGGWMVMRQRIDALLTAYPVIAATPGRSALLVHTAKFSTIEDAVSAVFSAHEEQSPLRRSFELYEAIQRLDAQQIGVLVQRAEALPDSDRRQLLIPLVARWHELDADAAAAWARPFLERAFASGRWGRDEFAALAWCRAAPERALEEALARPESMASEQIVQAAISSLVGGDPRATVERLALLPAGGLHERAMANALRQWSERDPAAAYAELARLRDPRQLEETQTHILAQWAEKEPRAALAHLQEVVPALNAQLYGSPLVNHVLRAAARNNHGEALELAARLPEALRTEGVAAALVEWAGQDAVAALEWAQAHGVPSDVQSHADGWTSLLDRAVASDGEKTVAWLRKLPSGQERNRLISQAIGGASATLAQELFGQLPPEWQLDAAQSVASKLTREDLDEGVHWTQQLPAGSARATAIANVMSGGAERFPTQIETLIEQFNPGPDRDAALRGCATSLGYQKPTQALEAAARIGASSVREEAFQMVFRSWFYSDTTAATRWLSTTSELTAETKEVLLRQVAERDQTSGY